MAEWLPVWAQDNFLLGVACGILFSFALLATWEWATIGLRWWKARRRAKLRAAACVPADRTPSPAPRPAPPRTPEPPADTNPGRETQAMPAVQPSMFTSPPPPSPTEHTHTIVPRDWDGQERRSTGGRHSSPDNGRRRRREDAYEKYDNPQ